MTCGNTAMQSASSRMRRGIALSGAPIISLKIVAALVVCSISSCVSLAAGWANPVLAMPRARHSDRFMYNFFMLTLLQREESARLVPEQVGVFLLLSVVDQLDVLIGDLLDLVEPFPLVVL